MSYRRLLPLFALTAIYCAKSGGDSAPGGDTESPGDSDPPGDSSPPQDTEGEDSDPEDSSPPQDTDSGDPEDSDSGPPKDTSIDTESEPEEGHLVIEGAAVVSPSWTGSEEILLRDDLGLGEVSCQIRYAVTSLAPAKDCEPCTTAFQVQLGAPEVIVGDHCEDVGYDAATIAALEGEVRSYGVALNYLGHANVLMMLEEGEWGPVAYVSWDEVAASVEYTWDQGYWTY